MNGGTNDVSNPNTYTVEDDITLGNPSRDGYDFVQWTEGSSIVLGSTGDKTFTAEWLIIDYNIYYELNGGTNDVSNPNTYTVEDDITLGNPTLQGYVFLGWFTNSEFTGDSVTQISLGSIGDESFYAKWEIGFFTIFFDNNEGFGIGSITQMFDTPVNAPLDPEREGFTFLGWYLASDDINYVGPFETEFSFVDLRMPGFNTFLIAKWGQLYQANVSSQNNFNNQFLFDYDLNNDVLDNIVTVSGFMTALNNAYNFTYTTQSNFFNFGFTIFVDILNVGNTTNDPDIRVMIADINGLNAFAINSNARDIFIFVYYQDPV